MVGRVNPTGFPDIKSISLIFDPAECLILNAMGIILSFPVVSLFWLVFDC